MTDNAALLLVALSLILILEDPASSVSAIGIGTIVSMATFIRQLNIWLVAPSLINSLIACGSTAQHGRDSTFKPRRLCAQKAIAPSFWSVFLFLPLLVLLILYASWGGLVPPKWSEAALSLSFCPAAYILSVFGVYGCAYVSSIAAKPLGHYLRLPSMRYLLAAGLIVALISPTSYSYESGRWGGFFWEIAKRMPTLAGRSIVFMILAPIGAAMIGMMFQEMRNRHMGRESVLWILSVFPWASTFVLNMQVFHRYFEVQVLVFFVIGVCILAKSGSRRPVADRLWPIYLLGLGQVGTLFLSLS